VQRAGGYDAVLLISVGVLGSPAEAVGACRRRVLPGGLMIIDDADLRQEEKLEFPGYAQLTARDETLRQLASHGDHVVREQKRHNQGPPDAARTDPVIGSAQQVADLSKRSDRQGADPAHPPRCVILQRVGIRRSADPGRSSVTRQSELRR